MNTILIDFFKALLIILKADNFYLKFKRRFIKSTSTGGSSSGRYCMLVAANHLERFLGKTDFFANSKVLEYGCGDSIGCGYLYIFLGFARYVGYDRNNYFSIDFAHSSLEEIYRLLISRKYDVLEKLKEEFPDVWPVLIKHTHVTRIWKNTSDDLLHKRYDLIRKSIQNKCTTGIVLYTTNREALLDWNEKFDLCFSQAVMEHPKNLKDEYKFISNISFWQSHSIDFGCHDCGLLWDQHYYYTDKEYEKIQSPFEFLWINRIPFSQHLILLKHFDFVPVKIDIKISSRLSSRMLMANSAIKIEEKDMRVAGAYVLLKLESK
jgi:hypothetical protein